MANISLAERFWAKVDKGGSGGDACWQWTAAVHGPPMAMGRSRFRGGPGWLTASPMNWRSAQSRTDCILTTYVEIGGASTRAHLEPVTQQENVRRGMVGEFNRQRMRSRTHCKYGHEFAPENTFLDARGGRQCRQCHRDRGRGRRARDASVPLLVSFQQAALRVHADSCGCVDPIGHIFTLAGMVEPE